MGSVAEVFNKFEWARRGTRLEASGAEVVQEPTEKESRNAGRDPAGNLIRIQELR